MAAKTVAGNAISKLPQCLWGHRTKLKGPVMCLLQTRHLCKRKLSTSQHEHISTDVSQFEWLNQFTKGIPVHGDHVRIYTQPKDYYELLMEKVASSQKRIRLSSLYLGTGELEQLLVDQIDKRMSTKPDLSCHLLLDCLRGTRGRPNSITILQPLLSKHPQAMRLSLYHTPEFRGVLKQVFPERFNEGMGLQHMKVYVFDDSVIISGANLSDSYFTNRQDRCVEFSRSPALADFYTSLLDTVCQHSFSVCAKGALHPPPVGIDPLASKNSSWLFKSSLREKVEKLSLPFSERELVSGRPEGVAYDGNCDTIVYPLVQMGQIGIDQDSIVTEKLLSSFGAGSRAYLASGYFNMPQLYLDVLVESNCRWNVLASSPEANGFYGAKGIAGHVPSMYVYFANRFLKQAQLYTKENDIKYFEYTRPGWTFHGKGLWYYPRRSQLPVASLVGSSNFGCRSLLHDLEAQALVVTKNSALQEALHEECCQLFEYSQMVSQDQAASRRIHWLEKVATLMLANRV